MATFQGKCASSADDGYFVETFDDSFDNSSNAVQIVAPNYTLETPNAIGFVRIPNVTIPSGSTITAAAFDLVSTTKVDTTGRNISIVGCAEDNSAQMSDQYDAAGRSLTSADGSGDFGSLTAGGSFTTFDFASVVQEIIDRGGWTSGNAMQFIFSESGGSGATPAIFASYDHATYTEPTLNITYTAGGGGGATAFLPAIAGLGW